MNKVTIEFYCLTYTLFLNDIMIIGEIMILRMEINLIRIKIQIDKWSIPVRLKNHLYYRSFFSLNWLAVDFHTEIFYHRHPCHKTTF